ncbi:tetratricopeptide repeat protein [Hyalangium versicolor]|uniref:tetratricopeptide repeat protein n=1 Tax=Hyalangium versicolor TaxID=2861190 RepID=UPI00281508D5|nr:tetratricopeptide repeat protein [Hyalangium versicolor]
MLHLTDLHFSEPSARFASSHYWNTTDWSSLRDGEPDYNRRGLLPSILGDLRSNRWVPDLVIISGDLLDRAQESGVALAIDFLTHLSEQLPLSRDRFVLVPGNHDEVRDAKTAEERYSLFSRIWTGFYAGLRPWIVGRPAHEQVELFDLCRELGIQIIGFNSCEGHDRGLFVGGAVGINQRERAEALLATSGEAPFRIAVMHHHLYAPIGTRKDLSVMEGAPEIRSWLKKHRFQLALHGHQHVDWHEEDSAGDWTLSVVAGASAGVGQYGRMHWDLRIGYQVIQIESEHDGCRFRRWYDPGKRLFEAGSPTGVENIRFGDRAPRAGKGSTAPVLEPGVLPEFIGYGSALPPYMLKFRKSLKENFVGRDKEVWRLHEALQGSRTGGPPRAPATVLLHAAGGFGKTRLALEYMHRFGPRCYPGGQFWVDAAVSSDLLEEQFHEILRRFKKDIPSLEVCRRPEMREALNIRKEVTEALEAAASRGPILFVVDNVPESAQRGGPRPPLETWCPVVGRVSLIVTSRDLWAGEDEALAVSALPPEAAEILLTWKLHESVRAQLDTQGALEVAKRVGYHPLALEILNKALWHGLPPAGLLETVRHQRPVEAVRKYFERVRHQEPDMKEGVFEAFELSYSKLTEPQQKLARLIAQLGAEPVPLVLAERLEPPGVEGKGLQMLRDRHFVTPVDDVEGVGMYGEMHRLLVDFLRERGDRSRQELRESCRALGAVIGQHDGNEPSSWPLLKACLPHAESVIERLTSPGSDTWTRRFVSEGFMDTLRRPSRGEELPVGRTLGRFLLASGLAPHAERIVRRVMEHAPRSAADEILELKVVLARALQAQGKYPVSEKLYGEVLEEARRNGERHWRTLRVRGLMAELVLEQGNPREALKLAEEVLTAWEERPHKDDSDIRDTVRARARVAAIWRALGRADKAKDLQQQVLEQRRQLSQTPAAQDASTLEVMSDLALSLYTLRYLDEAKTLQEQVLEARKRILGENHPDTLVVMDQLAETLRGLQKCKEARELQVPAIERMRKILGAEHPFTLRMEAHFAVTLRESGQLGAAREIQKRVLGLLERRLKPNHPMTLTVRSDLARTLHQAKRWEEARQLQVSVVNDRRWVLKEDHPDTMEAIGTLIQMLQEQGDWGNAARQLDRAQKDVENVLGKDHPETLRSMSYLALSLAAQRRWKEALTLQETVLEGRLRRWGEEHPDTLMAREDLSRTLHELGHYAAAAMHRKPVVEVSRRVLGPEHPATLTAMGNLAGTRMGQGDLAGARQLLEPVVEVSRRVLGPEHPDTLTAMVNLAVTLKRQGDLAGARQLLEPVVEVSRRVLGPEHPATLTAMGNLAGTRMEQGDLAGARQLEEPVVEVRRRVLGPEHPDTLTAMGNLAGTRMGQGDLAGARQLLEPVVEVRRRVLGPEHPDTLTAMGNLAVTLKRQGDLAGARQLLEPVVEVSRRVLGPEHPDTLTAMGNLAVTRMEQGDLAGARQLLEAVVEVRRRVLGPEHPDTLAAARALVDILKAQESSGDDTED